MQYLYTSEKPKFDKDKVDILYLRFDNGDSIPLHKWELLDVSINLYDALIADGVGFSPVAESGYILINVSKIPTFYPPAYIYNESEFKRDRKTYIENRCVKEGGLCAVDFRDDQNWGRTVYGDLSAEMRDGNLCLTYLPKRSGGASDGTRHTVSLRNVEKEYVRSIALDFENLEGFVVYEDEITEINLQFESALDEGSEALHRCIKDGYLTIKLDKSKRDRKAKLHLTPHPTCKQLEKRLIEVGETLAAHDICNLCVCYWDTVEEWLGCDDIRPDEELDRLEKAEEEGEGYLDFIGGYCQRLSDGSIKIMFGKSLHEKFKSHE